MTAKYTVFYMRYSSGQQREDSIVDQRRNIVNHLDRLGIPHEGAIELSDKAISGTHTNRPGFQKLSAMLDKGEVGLLVVDDLSRLTRGNDVGAMWDQMEAQGCRFISVSDGIDSIREGDEVGALFKGIMNKMTNQLHGKRVRRGVAGRALDKFGSAGYHPYGYGTRYCDPEAALNYSGSRPRPKKEIFIDEEEAPHVREVFRLFAEEGWSKLRITRHLNSNNACTGKRARIVTESGTCPNPTWNNTRITRILNQRKYIGIWRYGENICKKTATGRLVMRPADPKDIIEVHNSELAIVSQELWDKAQARLTVFKDQKGYKFGQKKRGPTRHYTEDYPIGTCGGIVYCGECGKRMYHVPEINKRGKKYGPYYRCANAIANGLDERGGRCGHKSFIREERIHEALSRYVENHLRSCDGWLDEVISEVRKACASHNASAPGELKRLRERRKETALFITNITSEIERGGGKSIPGMLFERLKALETELNGIDAAIHRLEAAEEKEESFPSSEWIKEQLADLASVFAESPDKTGKLFRQLFGKVYVRTVLAPGKKRGHSVISFTPNNNNLVIQVVNLDGISGLESLAHQERNAETVSIALPGYDKLDKLIPTIDSMLQKGRTWANICHELGIDKQWAAKCHKNWKQQRDAEPTSPAPLPHDTPEDSSGTNAV